jgi:hypothetical protein
MAIAFNKYQGTGNDFIIIDNRNLSFNPADNKFVRSLCDRRFGIGGDRVTDIWLSGPATFVLRGRLRCKAESGERRAESGGHRAQSKSPLGDLGVKTKER